MSIQLNREEALRWLEQAEHNLQVARHNQAGGFYSDACFMAEQAAQVALKDSEEMVDAGKILNRYYISTRYPDAIASPAVPYKTYTGKDAVEAIGLAERIISLTKQRL